MLVHLLEGIVNRYHIGTLFAPYGKEIFVVFQLDKTRNLKNREQQLLEYVQIIERNMLQYINEKILFGISEEFSKLEELSTLTTLGIPFTVRIIICFSIILEKESFLFPTFPGDHFWIQMA